ncbi:Protein of unknown function (DUF3558) [Streptoalloteichus tenebrarius]|uniref:DUF3558 domain-containing protein n=1 Tax=Streptoalloteichus tenebrarius (strain ATCC 17920 / DSM 40477 / JCM 4838 / CBS 697.72 / NBRC 16177 / NCIMB 11028 / NRRL B-12390 / A12253. 1 / ISP 5477) TaxID=1933 RepID=A0ABT1I4L1_STRSD|nr:DUF3558 domain-containing protein [Streptoalloteichus tenebrarius]MCP2262661.1 Protein of unknown function (DUF3558) [Streptoalloteichus tenebrarius]BFF02100.1 hypothetical protein GCM10020241_37750 [Streptoalloteichus tenebrarius]
MSKIQGWRTGILVLAGLVAAGCSSSTTGTPTAADHATTPPATTSGPTNRSPSARTGPSLAPRVSNPKNLRGQDACQLLTPQQQAELTFTKPGEKGTSAFGESECRWSNGNLRIYLALDTKRRGLEETYLRKERFPDFTPSTVAGYPAVRTGLNDKLKSCRVDLGVADDQVLYITFDRNSRNNPEYEDPCGFAEKVGKMVLDNLPPAG